MVLWWYNVRLVDLENKIMDDLQKVEGTVVSKECQVLQIAIYIRVQQ